MTKRQSVRVSNYVTTEDYSYPKESSSPWAEKLTLAKGSFVQPIWHYYVPKFISEEERWKGMGLDTHTFAFTSQGIILILRSIIREIV